MVHTASGPVPSTWEFSDRSGQTHGVGKYALSCMIAQRSDRPKPDLDVPHKHDTRPGVPEAAKSFSTMAVAGQALRKPAAHSQSHQQLVAARQKMQVQMEEEAAAAGVGAESRAAAAAAKAVATARAALLPSAAASAAASAASIVTFCPLLPSTSGAEGASAESISMFQGSQGEIAIAEL